MVYSLKGLFTEISQPRLSVSPYSRLGVSKERQPERADEEEREGRVVLKWSLEET